MAAARIERNDTSERPRTARPQRADCECSSASARQCCTPRQCYILSGAERRSTAGGDGRPSTLGRRMAARAAVTARTRAVECARSAARHRSAAQQRYYLQLGTPRASAWCSPVRSLGPWLFGSTQLHLLLTTCYSLPPATYYLLPPFSHSPLSLSPLCAVLPVSTRAPRRTEHAGRCGYNCNCERGCSRFARRTAGGSTSTHTRGEL